VVPTEPAPDAVPLIPVEVDDALRALLVQFPLPAGVEDADCNQEQIAMALGQSVTTVAKWIRQDGMPVAQEGGNGRAYVLRLSHCWAWRQARLDRDARKERHTKSQIDALQASFLGLDIEDPNARLSPSERKAIADADIAYSRAARDRRQLVPLVDVVDLLESICKIIRDGIEGMPDRLERELGLKPEQVNAAVRLGSDILNKMTARIEEAELRERDVSEVQVESQWVI
jgi:phage terminase Nu1 subunit (DNA packaging protein)